MLLTKEYKMEVYQLSLDVLLKKREKLEEEFRGDYHREVKNNLMSAIVINYLDIEVFEELIWKLKSEI